MKSRESEFSNSYNPKSSPMQAHLYKPKDRAGNRAETKGLKAILVNPWIYDFAAYNFWIRPLGLYRVAEWLWERGLDVELIDCLSQPRAPGRFERIQVSPPLPLSAIRRRFARYGIPEEEYKRRIIAAQPFDVAFVTSIMSYWYPGVKHAITAIRESNPDAIIVLGGVYATLWKRHAEREMGADLVLEGPIEAHASRLSSLLNISKEAVRPGRPWYLLGLHDGADFSATRTAIGCPFRCTYCGSHRISGDYRPRSAEDTLEELTCLYSMGVRQIAFYDDALLVDFEHRLKPILDGVLKRGISFRFHTPNGLHARLVTREVAHYFKRCGFKTIRLSLESSWPERQQSTGAKVTNDALVEAVNNLLKAGIDREHIGVYLLCGLPDQDAREVADSIRFVKKLEVRPYLAEFSPIPGTPEWERLLRTRTISQDMDPLYTNNTLFFRLYSRIGEKEWKRLQALRNPK